MFTFEYEFIDEWAMESDLSARLLAEARRHTPTLVERSRLMPFREALLTFRAKHTSYERIAGILKGYGVAIHPATIGYFCRRYCPEAEIQRVRLNLVTAATGASTVVPPSHPPAERRRAPRIARDDL